MNAPVQISNTLISIFSAVQIPTVENHLLTPKNSALLIAQCAERGMTTPSLIGGFNQWQKQGRTVRKGEKSLKIFAPRPFKKEENAGKDLETMTTTELMEIAKDTEKKKGFRYIVISVFDISQTEVLTTAETQEP